MLCGASRRTLVARALRDSTAHRVVRCSACAMIQLSPLPDTEAHDAFHREDRQTRGLGVAATPRTMARRKAWDTARRSAWIGAHVRRGARLLDVGSGYGTLLGALRQRGIRSVGLEPSPARLRVSRRLSGAPVVAGDLYRIPAELIGFDAIALIHVLEHLTDPVAALRALRARVRAGGLLFVEVPNADDLLLHASPEYRQFYWQRAHAGYYSPATLRAVLRKAGWVGVDVAGVQRYGIENLASWLGRGVPQLSKPSFETSGPYAWLERQYKASLEACRQSDTLLAVARAPHSRRSE
jgi:SAM-dependent methyltransferase